MDSLGLTFVSRNGNDGDTETGSDQPFHSGDLGGFEHDVGVDAVVCQQLVGELSQARLLAERDEWLARRRRQPHRRAAREPVSVRDGKAQLIDIQPAPNETSRLRTRCGDGDIGLAVDYPQGDVVCGPLKEIEADCGSRLAKAPQLFGYVPIRRQCRKASRTRPVSG